MAMIKELAMRDKAIAHEEALAEVSGDHPLTVFRRRRGLTMRQLAEQSGISVAMISKVESNSRALSKDLAAKAAAALGCDVSELLDEGYISRPVPRAVPVVSLAEALAFDGGRGIQSKADRQFVGHVASPGAKIVAVMIKDGEYAGFFGVIDTESKEGCGTFLRMDEEVNLSIGEGVPDGSYAIGKIISVTKAI